MNNTKQGMLQVEISIFIVIITFDVYVDTTGECDRDLQQCWLMLLP